MNLAFRILGLPSNVFKQFDEGCERLLEAGPPKKILPRDALFKVFECLWCLPTPMASPTHTLTKGTNVCLHCVISSFLSKASTALPREAAPLASLALNGQLKCSKTTPKQKFIKYENGKPKEKRKHFCLPTFMIPSGEQKNTSVTFTYVVFVLRDPKH